MAYPIAVAGIDRESCRRLAFDSRMRTFNTDMNPETSKVPNNLGIAAMLSKCGARLRITRYHRSAESAQ